MEPKSEQAGDNPNPNPTLGGGAEVKYDDDTLLFIETRMKEMIKRAGGAIVDINYKEAWQNCSSQQIEHWKKIIPSEYNFDPRIALAASMGMARISPNYYNYEEAMPFKDRYLQNRYNRFYLGLKVSVDLYEQYKRWDDALPGMCNELKNKFEEFLRASSEAHKENKISDLEKNLEVLGAQLKVSEENVIKAREEARREAAASHADKEKIKDLEKNLEDLGAKLKVAEENVIKAREKARKEEGRGQESLRSYDLRSRTRHNNMNS